MARRRARRTRRENPRLVPKALLRCRACPRLGAPRPRLGQREAGPARLHGRAARPALLGPSQLPQRATSAQPSPAAGAGCRQEVDATSLTRRQSGSPFQHLTGSRAKYWHCASPRRARREARGADSTSSSPSLRRLGPARRDSEARAASAPSRAFDTGQKSPPGQSVRTRRCWLFCPASASGRAASSSDSEGPGG
jgi:hypothetical protein